MESVVMTAVMIFSVFMAIGIFMVLPLLIAGFFRRFIQSETVMAVLEGVIRIGIFIAYIKIISRMDDIRRTFMYHGSEHNRSLVLFIVLKKAGRPGESLHPQDH